MPAITATIAPPGTCTLHLLAQEYYLQQQGLAELAIRPEYLEAARAFYAGDDADHRGIFLYGVIDQEFWFDTIANLR